MRTLIPTTLLSALALVTGCGDDFDRVSEVKTVRVLGVRKTPTFPEPGQTVEHTMLWHDGRADTSRPVQITWLGGCDNPPGDQFFGCFDSLAETVSALDSPSDPRIGLGETFSYTIPDDVISSRDAPPDPNQPAFGTSFVFFAACAGRLGLDPSPPEGALPIGCFDDANRRLGADDWVLGYTTSFAYEQLDNALPVVTGFRVAGRDVPADCLDEGCVGDLELEPIDCATGDPRCIDACRADGDEAECPEIAIEPIVDPSTVETDPIASAAKETTTYEQVWIDYFSSRGRVGGEIRLYSGADTGPRDDYASRLFAPAEPGPLFVWAVVKDNRGGVSWVRVRLEVR